jgi:Cu/Ag efflux protein CusF
MTQFRWIGKTLIGLGVLTIGVLPTLAIASQTSSAIARGETVTAQATVVAIDKAKRMVTLRGPKGNDFNVYADEHVQRFNELKVGDVVTATYAEALAVSVRKPGLPDPAKKTEAIVRQKDQLAATATREQTVTVTIQAIDLTAPSVTAKGPEGRTHTFKVKDKNNLRDLKVGDTVDITFTEALLVRADRSK